MNQARSDLLNLRRSSRYHVKQAAAITVEVLSEVDGEQRTAPCELADISTQGLKLKTTSTFAIKQVVRIKLRVDVCELTVDRKGEVCWSRPCDQRFSWVGILLHDEISIELLDRFAVEGIIDRRRDRRLAVNADAYVRFELGAETHRARILDVSQGGFSIVTSKTVNVGDRILLIVDRDVDETPVPGRIFWMRADGETCMYGCEFLSSTAATDVRTQLARREVRLVQPSANLSRSTSSLTLLASITCLITVLCWYVGHPMTSETSSSSIVAPVHVEVITPVAVDQIEHSRPIVPPPPAITESAWEEPPPHPLVPYVERAFHRWTEFRFGEDNESKAAVDSSLQRLSAEGGGK